MPEMMSGLTSFEQGAVWVVLLIALLGIGYAFFLRAQIFRRIKALPACRKCGASSRRAQMPT